MKHILDSSFRYKPSFDTDVRKTFERVRRQQHVRERAQVRESEEQTKAAPPRIKVLQLDQLKKASST